MWLQFDITIKKDKKMETYDTTKEMQVDDAIAKLEEKESGAFLDETFINQMRYELRANAEKGNWQEWKPTYEEFCEELDHHVAKLKIAINYANYKDVKEFSADTANICEKAFTTWKEFE
jgi:hypothetical protein